MSPEVQVKAVTLTHGNIGINRVQRNAVSILNVIADYRRSMKIDDRMELPVVAVGASKPLEVQQVTAEHVHGKDGLGEIYDDLYKGPADWASQLLHETEMTTNSRKAFKTTSRDAADEILYQLEKAPPLSISICAVGPLTNIALAYQRNPIVFSRAKRIVIMGGAIHEAGNVTPTAEFNFRADPHAADLVMSASKGFEHTPEGYNHRLDLIQQGKQAPSHIVILPLDAAEDGCVTRQDNEKYIRPLRKTNSLTSFCNALMVWVFTKYCELLNTDSLAVYDAYTVLLLIDMIADKGDGPSEDFNQLWQYKYLDLRVETGGIYTQGMCCYDRRAGPRELAWGSPNQVQVMLSGKGQRFNQMFLNRIFDAKIAKKEFNSI
ncbi:hypothetical protein DFQ28_003643 [Apophysomyces sp. BC1034]|nr:hypothetical protein DFQ28_003643 [Apophysomyces sp. BC1034]